MAITTPIGPFEIATELGSGKKNAIYFHHSTVHTLQGINISHLGKRKIIFKMPFWGDMLVPWRVFLCHFHLFYPFNWLTIYRFVLPSFCRFLHFFSAKKNPRHQRSTTPAATQPLWPPWRSSLLTSPNDHHTWNPRYSGGRWHGIEALGFWK